jgi:hypothetical protein
MYKKALLDVFMTVTHYGPGTEWPLDLADRLTNFFKKFTVAVQSGSFRKFCDLHKAQFSESGLHENRAGIAAMKLVDSMSKMHSVMEETELGTLTIASAGFLQSSVAGAHLDTAWATYLMESPEAVNGCQTVDELQADFSVRLRSRWLTESVVKVVRAVLSEKSSFKVPLEQLKEKLPLCFCKPTLPTAEVDIGDITGLMAEVQKVGDRKLYNQLVFLDVLVRNCNVLLKLREVVTEDGPPTLSPSSKALIVEARLTLKSFLAVLDRPGMVVAFGNAVTDTEPDLLFHSPQLDGAVMQDKFAKLIPQELGDLIASWLEAWRGSIMKEVRGSTDAIVVAFE